MLLKHRVKRLASRTGHLSHYLKTLHQANNMPKTVDFSRTRRPVLLLYGFGATRRSLSILEARLKCDGFDVFSINLGGFMELFNTGPIDRAAQKVADKIEDLCGRYHLPRISIIGYSKGGLIGRYYVNCLGGNKRVHTLITLATPHQGNPWVLLPHFFGVGFLSKGLRQMLPRSRFIKKLNRMPHPEDVYAVSIASQRDRQCPPKYCRLPQNGNDRAVFNVVLSQLYHSDFVMKHKAYEEILRHLNAGYDFFAQNGVEGGPQSPLKKAGY
ncbi:MAG: alpha/beta hydrolase [Deltaproteobacteria bacterium]|nr:alpha/beta hydrolase [Deltaproteobacteria bacterium]